MPVVELGPDRCEALLTFFGSLAAGDLTFIKEEVTDPDTVRSWASDASPGGRWVAVDGPEVTGYVAVRPLPGWSDHVGEVRLVVSPTRRGSGLGRELARRAVVEGVSAGLSKLVVVDIALNRGQDGSLARARLGSSHVPSHAAASRAGLGCASSSFCSWAAAVFATGALQEPSA